MNELYNEEIRLKNSLQLIFFFISSFNIGSYRTTGSDVIGLTLTEIGEPVNFFPCVILSHQGLEPWQICRFGSPVTLFR